jgi:hypothetical protein
MLASQTIFVDGRDFFHLYVNDLELTSNVLEVLVLEIESRHYIY